MLQDENTLINKPSLIVIIFALCFSFWLVDFWRPVNFHNGETLFGEAEIFERYSFLPALFLNKASFEWPGTLKNQNPIDPLHKPVPKFNYGSALLDLPFFIIAYCQSRNQLLTPGGFSAPFAGALHWSGIFYAIAALFFLRKVLLTYFSERVTALTLFLCLFGNPLFYYTFSMGELPQTKLFFLFCLFLRYTQLWHQEHKISQILICGIITGLLSLINFFEIYILLFFFCWDVSTLKSLKSNFHLFKQHRRQLTLFLVPILILWIPQLLFNFHYTGQWLTPAEPKEKYDFTDARINEMLFGFRYGWITYSPLMLFVIPGIFLLKKQFPISKHLFLFAILLLLVVYSSWWDRSYGGYYGARRLVPAMAWLSVPLAVFITKIFQSRAIHRFDALLRLSVSALLFLCICFTCAQSYQVIHKRIIPSEMDGTRYWKTLRTFKFADDK
ncbi:MAG: hypothetical protein PSX36_12720 [bacterium]|nr:hypothetical protein [bacterium]